VSYVPADAKECGNCSQEVAALSSGGWCESCEAAYRMGAKRERELIVEEMERLLSWLREGEG
jgi:hypothetical protein